MIHQCPCGCGSSPIRRATSLKRDHDVSDLTGGELARARRDLAASLALARPGSMTSVPIMAQLRAIDAELASRGGGG